jgi:hypothetical protein
MQAMISAQGRAAADVLRPRRFWYVVSALIAGGGVLAAAALPLLAFIPIGADLGQRVTAGQPVAVHITGPGKVVWIADDGPGAADPTCETSPADRPSQWSTQRMLGEDLSLDAEGRHWRAALIVAAEPAGTYTVTCVVPGANAGRSLAIGDPPWFHGPRARALAIPGAMLTAAVGVLVGCLLAVRVAVRRRRGQLLHQAATGRHEGHEPVTRASRA